MTRRRAIGTRVIAVVAVIVILGATGVIVVTSQPTTSTISTTSTSCSGAPPDGDCPGTFSYTFTISVNYAGTWTLNYQGYDNLEGYYNLGNSNPTVASGKHTGSGFYSKPVTLSGPNDIGLTLCASAQKLDGSNSTLILMGTGTNETSLPYGSTSSCVSVAP
jgi:hypothetical protein